MSTPSNPSSIMIYKILNDFEKSGRTIYSIKSLNTFAEKVLEKANEIDDEQYWLLESPEIKEDLSRICDLTQSICEINEEKLKNGGERFAKIKIGLMPYSWLKGTIIVLNDIEEMKSDVYLKAKHRKRENILGDCSSVGNLVVEDDIEIIK